MGLSVVPALKARVMAVEFVKNNPRIKAMLDHPAGPFTRRHRIVHFWAPSFKWGISLANIADFNRPAEFISVPQQLAVTATGIIWSRYSFVITPVNYNLFSVNAFMAVTGSYQLWRKFTTQATPTAPPNSASVSS